MQITTTELRQALTKILDHLDEAGQATVTINKDYYWAIPPHQQYDPYEKPKEFTLGQLSDDWLQIKKINEGQSVPVGYALVWLSTIIRAVGEENVA